MSDKVYDIVIVGGGPGGLTAGLYAARAKLEVLLIEKLYTGGQMAQTDAIENYPGFDEPISGYDLTARMDKQARRLGLKIENTELLSIRDAAAPVKTLETNEGSYRAKSVIIGTGASPRKLEIPGELEYAGKGVSYCAVCDGAFYRGKEVVVIGGGDSAVEEAGYLTRFASKVTLVHRRDELRANKTAQEEFLESPKSAVVWDSVPLEIVGDKGVTGVLLQNVKTGQVERLACAGVFIYVGIIPRSEEVAAYLQLDESGFIVVDLHMATSVPGIFAIGDVRSGSVRQIASAVGDGVTAEQACERYIRSVG